jgi:CubicO group peptidase (beta-lactamase class C family)
MDQGPGPEDLFDGVWVMDAGVDQFLWDFSGDPVGCVVHAIRDHRLINDTPCAAVDLDGDRVVVRMDTGVRLEGRLDLSRRAIVGGLSYPDGSATEQDLEWSREAGYPSLRALPEGGDAYAYEAPGNTGDGWAVGRAEQVGVDPAALEETVRSIARGEGGVVHSLLVARGGRLILEEYFHGYGPDDLHPLASCTKSVSSLLVGLAIQSGAIPGGFQEAVRTPLLTFFPEDSSSAGQGWRGLTLQHLLTMTMALDWSRDQVQNFHATGPEAFRQILARNVSGTPGEDFEYASINVNLIAGILRETTGMQAEEFAATELFQPLGIEAWDWSGLKTEGYNLMDGSLHLRPRDMAKLGAMVLDGGRWKGRQVVDEAWIRQSTARILDAGQGPEGYGYLWWRMEVPGPGGAAIPAVFANGWGSQFIAVFPGLDLVVITTGGNEFNGKHMAMAQVLGNRLLPGVE